MGYLQLRFLFELLCDGLEEEKNHLPLHFVGAYGLELPSQVMMIFVFQEGMIFCQFSVQDDFDHPKGTRMLSRPLSMNECLDMKDQLRSFSGGVTELFA
jgi:hypothetical protein